MAASYSSGYGTYNPRALEPYPIEGTLAQLGYSAYGNSPAEAQTLMDQYWYERQGNEEQYQKELDAQHAQFVANLQQQMQDARWKAMAEAKDPTVLQLFASSPDSPLAGISTDALSDLVVRARQGQDVTNLQHAGTGINQISQAGFDPTQAAAGVGITNLGDYSGPAMVQAARINAAARIAAARLNAGGGGDKFSTTGPPDPTMGGASPHVTFGRGTTFEQAQERGRQYFAPQGSTEGGGPGPGPVNPPPSQRTNLPPAKTDEGTARNVSPAASPTDRQKLQDIRTLIEQNRSKMPADAYKDLQDGISRNGGNPILRRGPDGRDHLYGASGKAYS